MCVFIYLFYSYTSGLQVKSPSIPFVPHGQGGGELDGYNFETYESQLASYWYVLHSFNRLKKSNSNDFSFKTWFEKGRFILPFSLTGEIKEESEQIEGNTNETILKPLNSGQSLQLYTRFEAPTTKVLRISVLITQFRSIAIEADRSTSRFFEVDQ